MKNKIRKWITLLFTAKGKDLGLLVIRLCFGGMMLMHGTQKLVNFEQYSKVFPDPLGIGENLSFALITMAEVGGSIFLIIGLLTRLAAIPLIIGMSVAAFIAVPHFSFSNSELPLLYLCVFTTLFITGGGHYSFDGIIARKALK